MEQELSGVPEPRPQLQSWQGEVPKPYSSVPRPLGSSDGCTCGVQHAGWEAKREKLVKGQGGRNFEKGTSAQGMTKNQGFSCLCSQEKVESTPWKSC